MQYLDLMHVRRLLTQWSSALLLPRIFSPSPRHALTTLLYHKFFTRGESINSGRERLRRQLEWLRDRYHPLSFAEAITRLTQGTLPEFPLLVTADDAKLDLLDCYDLFSEFKIPLAIAVCVGWAENQEPLNSPGNVARIVDFLQWYDGPERVIDVVGHPTFVLGSRSRDQAIDQVLRQVRGDGQPFLDRVCEALSRLRRTGRSRTTCNWSEIEDLHRQGAVIGSHTISHCRLAACSDLRLRFELEQSKASIAGRFGGCEMFAYPYGTFDVATPRTAAAIAAAGYRGALLTHAGFASRPTAAFGLPRIVIPDTELSMAEFQSRVRGGEIPFNLARKIAARTMPRRLRTPA